MAIIENNKEDLTREEWAAPAHMPAWQLAVFIISIVLMASAGIFVATHEDHITTVNTSN